MGMSPVNLPSALQLPASGEIAEQVYSNFVTELLTLVLVSVSLGRSLLSPEGQWRFGYTVLRDHCGALP